MAAEKKQKKICKPHIYIGPNLEQGRLLAYTVFREGVPPYLKDLRQKHSELDALIVPVSGLKEGLEKINLAGTIENLAFHAIKGDNKNGI